MTINQPGDGEGQSPGSTADQDITFKGKTPIRQRHRAGVRDRQLSGQPTIPEITVQEQSERRITGAGNRRGHHGGAVRLDSRHTHQVSTIPERGSMHSCSTPCCLEQSRKLDLANPWPAAPGTPAWSHSHSFATIG